MPEASYAQISSLCDGLIKQTVPKSKIYDHYMAFKDARRPGLVAPVEGAGGTESEPCLGRRISTRGGGLTRSSAPRDAASGGVISAGSEEEGETSSKMTTDLLGSLDNRPR